MEVSGIAIVTCRDAAEVLKAVEHALNGISRPIKDRRSSSSRSGWPWAGCLARRPYPRSVDAPRWCRSPCRRGSAGRSRPVPAAGPLPCNPRRCRRSARRRPAGRRHPSARGSWSCARHAIGRWPAVAPPFSAGGAAMGLHGRTVDQKAADMVIKACSYGAITSSGATGRGLPPALALTPFS
ncbi:hypothetical protein CD178_02533 [Komagataeibacter saccharivorans]|uniref:Uncharacterized protein n=1 Tax=Komagataeibacter saccharivorans TaxID=265959 RepID=A0A347WEI7_9PROT|nr:hypothetical protein CD178_02533 [Komagataeibacter saccharivorans]